jgi:putative DNA primase/helicase
MEFDCSVILVHHTGVSEEAQHRARGSSAWRGALDIEISIVPGKKDQPLQIVQRKSKDAELAETIYVDLQQVAIPGWLDEEGQPVTSAVVVQANPPVIDKKDSKITSHRKTFENGWWAAGAEERNGQPYLSRSAFMDYLTRKLDLSEASARQYIKPSAPESPLLTSWWPRLLRLLSKDGLLLTRFKHPQCSSERWRNDKLYTSYPQTYPQGTSGNW